MDQFGLLLQELREDQLDLMALAVRLAHLNLVVHLRQDHRQGLSVRTVLLVHSILEVLKILSILLLLEHHSFPESLETLEVL